MLHEKATDIFNSQNTSRESNVHERLRLLNDDIAKLEDQVRTLIRKQATTPEAVHQIFDEEIQKVSAQIKNMRDAYKRLQGESLTVK